MKRIMRFVKDIQSSLREYDEELFRIAVGSIVLFCWSHDQPEEAPSMEFLQSKTKDKFGLTRREEIPKHEAAWNAMLESYGYTWSRVAIADKRLRTDPPIWLPLAESTETDRTTPLDSTSRVCRILDDSKCSGDLDRYPLSAYFQQVPFVRRKRLVAKLINFFPRHPCLTQGFGHVVDYAKVVASLGHHADANSKCLTGTTCFPPHLMPIQCYAVTVWAAL
jgi:hypothetical protein